MFTDDFCEDWDSTKNQDDFIKKYFSKEEAGSTKTSSLSKSNDKFGNIRKNTLNKTGKDNSEQNYLKSQLLKNKHFLSDELESDKKKKRKEIPCDSSKEVSEKHFQSRHIEMTESSANELISTKRNKKRKLENKIKNILSEPSDQMMDTKDTITKTDFPAISAKNIDMHSCEVNSNSQKSKRKRKRLKKKANCISDEKHLMSGETDDTISDAMLNDSSIRNNNYSKSLKKKKKDNKTADISLENGKFSDEAEFSNSEDSHALSVRKNNLLQNKAYQKLQAAKFRYLNEMLYTNSGNDALSYFQENTDEFQDYHQGYQSQVSKWPINPVDIIIQEISQVNEQAVIADLGCGEAKIAEVFPKRKIHSFDLIALKDCVTACDIANLPLPSSSVDIVVFCLSLMGTNWKEYLKEGHRILKVGGIMKIAEIESRIENLHHFIKEIESFGFSLINQNLSHKMFVFLNFNRTNKRKKPSKVHAVTLKPCLYKKR